MKSVESIVNDMACGEAIDFLIENEDGFVISKEELNKIKAEAVRDLANAVRYNNETDDILIEDAYTYANELERGEL